MATFINYSCKCTTLAIVVMDGRGEEEWEREGREGREFSIFHYIEKNNRPMV